MQKWIILIIILIITILGIIIVLNVDIETEYVPEAEIEEQDLRKTIVSLYYKDIQTNEIVEETRLIDSKELLKKPYETLVRLLISGPENSNNVKIIPDSVNLISTNYENGCVVINFNDEFEKLNQEDKDLIFESIYNTLTKLTEVTDIKIIVNGNEQENIINETNVTALTE